MRIRLRTLVAQPPATVFAGFTSALFARLAPPFPRVRLLRFDGNAVGDIVEVRLHFGLFSAVWRSIITAYSHTGEEIFFVDEGERLPFFLRYWHHKHRILPTADGDGGSIIIDEITYKSPFWLLDVLLYPAMYLQFAYRKPIYRGVFRKGA